MAGQVKAIPEGYHTLTPYLVVQNGARLVEFLEEGLGAKLVHRMDHLDGSLWHADLQVGDSHVMLGGASEDSPATPASIYVYVEDADAAYRRALAAGGVSIMEPQDNFYGDRHGGITDPPGNTWWLATHIEDVSDEELAKRGKAAGEERKRRAEGA